MKYLKFVLINIITIGLFSCSSGENKDKNNSSKKVNIEPKATVLISYFDNTSELEKYKNLSKGLADMLISDLSNIDIIRIVEREKLESILSEIELANTEYFDPATAQQLGKGLGADLILTGAFLSIEPMMRIDARIIDVATGEIMQGNKVEGNIEDFFQLQNQLASLITKELDITVEGFAEKVIPKTSLSEVLDYSKSIDYLDRGFEKQAKEILQKTLENNPDFAYADMKIKAVQNKLFLLEESKKLQEKEKMDEMMKSLNPKSKTFGADLMQLYGSAGKSGAFPYGKKSTLIAINRMVLEMDVMDKEMYPGPTYGGARPMLVEDIYMYQYLFEELYPKNDYKKIIEVGLPYLEKLGNTSTAYSLIINNVVKIAAQQLERRAAGKKKLDAYLEENPQPSEDIINKNFNNLEYWQKTTYGGNPYSDLIKKCEEWAQYEKAIELRKDFIFYLTENSDIIDTKGRGGWYSNGNDDLGMTLSEHNIYRMYLALAENYYEIGNIYEPVKIYSTIMSTFSQLPKWDGNYRNRADGLKQDIEGWIN